MYTSMHESRPVSITITPGTVATVVFVLLGFWVAYYLRDVILIVLTAVVLASAIEPATLYLMRVGLPRVLSGDDG